MLKGILVELQKVDRLTRYEYLTSHILLPALAYARERALVTPQEAAVLQVAVRAGIAKAGDLAQAMPDLNPTQRTYQVRKLLERKLLQPIAPGARQYTLGFDNNHLLRGVIHALTAEGFISPALAGGNAAY